MIAETDVAAQLEELRHTAEELRRTVDALRTALAAPPRVVVRAVESAPYLGQAVGLVVEVTRRDGATPVAGVPVTLVTAFGVLRGADDLVEGTSVRCATGADGTARATLRARVALERSEDQDALEAALAGLDPAAPSPAAATAALETFARQYRWEANRGLRAAVDAYFRRFGEGALPGGGLADSMAAWPLIPATVVAFAADPASPDAVAATVTVALRDWRGPWLQVYRRVAAALLQPGPDLTFVRQQALTAAGLVAGVFDRVGLLVDGEFGELGKRVASEAAQKAIGTFLDTGIADLPAATRATIGTVLNTGARALVSAGPSVLGALGQAHAATAAVAGSLATKVEKADFDAALVSKASVTDLQAVQASVAAKADRSALTAFQAQTAAALATKTDATVFDAFRRQVNDRLTITPVRADLETVRAGLQASIDTNKAAVDTFRSQTTAALATKVETSTLAAVQNRVGALEVRLR